MAVIKDGKPWMVDINGPFGFQCNKCMKIFDHVPRFHYAPSVPMTRDAAGISHGIGQRYTCTGEVVKAVAPPTPEKKDRMIIPLRLQPPSKDYYKGAD